jgi:hypothetical protein
MTVEQSEEEPGEEEPTKPPWRPAVPTGIGPQREMILPPAVVPWTVKPASCAKCRVVALAWPDLMARAMVAGLAEGNRRDAQAVINDALSTYHSGGHQEADVPPEAGPLVEKPDYAVRSYSVL